MTAGDAGSLGTSPFAIEMPLGYITSRCSWRSLSMPRAIARSSKARSRRRASEASMDDHGRDDPCREENLDRLLEDFAEPLFAPTLAQPRQARMIRRLFMQTVSDDLSKLGAFTLR